MRPRRLQEIRVDTLDLAAALDAWRAASGLTPASRDGESARMRAADVTLLVAAVGDEAPEGLAAITLTVDDLDAAADELRRRGVDVSEPETTAGGTRSVMIGTTSTHGVPIRLAEEGT